MKKRYRATVSLVLMAHIAVLVTLFITRAAATRVPLSQRPMTIDVSLAASSVPQSISQPDERSNAQLAQPHRSAITPSTNRVFRETMRQEPTLRTTEQIANQLFASMTSTTREANPAHHRDAEILRAAFHGAWIAPSKHEAGNASVIARVIFAPDGSVQQARIESPSGIPSFDSSVLAALGQVSRVAGLSEATRSKRDGVTFAFSVEE